MRRKLVLVILDGWGIGNNDGSNPLYVSQPPNIMAIKRSYLAGALQSSGIAVGLPWEEEGNSEVGHLTIGAGKVIYQHFPRITMNIQSGDFFKNKAFVGACGHVKQYGSALHIAGSLTQGNVHASLEHVRALIRLAKEQGVSKVYFHFFTDGKDSPPKSAPALLGEVRTYAKEQGVGEVASIAGRFYALDRDEHWDRTEKAYRVMTGEGLKSVSAEARIQEAYAKGLGDEFIDPASVQDPPHTIAENDALIFFDFREDSIRQIASAFGVQNFSKFPVRPIPNLYLATMTQYTEKIQAHIAFPVESVENPLGKVLSDNGLIQLRIAETEKYAHVTFFFNAYREQPFPNEYRVLIPSRNVSRADLHPDMMANEIGTRILESIEEGGFDVIIANFANPDATAHTGNFEAALSAIKTVDEEIGRIAKACKEQNAILMVTSDHGNVERMTNPLTGAIETKHDANIVPIYIVGNGFERHKSDMEAAMIESEAVGILSDVAPTILELLEIPKPAEMTGESLLKVLR
ncbi:MAG: 2,3-bisphosphoglycerate-independent phosphoglycerate mutase [Patescibacteria group bacterium]